MSVWSRWIARKFRQREHRSRAGVSACYRRASSPGGGFGQHTETRTSNPPRAMSSLRAGTMATVSSAFSASESTSGCGPFPPRAFPPYSTPLKLPTMSCLRSAVASAGTTLPASLRSWRPTALKPNDGRASATSEDSPRASRGRKSKVLKDRMPPRLQACLGTFDFRPDPECCSQPSLLLRRNRRDVLGLIIRDTHERPITYLSRQRNQLQPDSRQARRSRKQRDNIAELGIRWLVLKLRTRCGSSKNDFGCS
jgi:hypothetical protein